MEASKRELIIEIPYAGFGDHLFHSHLPRIAKESGAYDKVFISSRSPIRQQDHLDLVWNLNPHVDGFRDQSGLTCNLMDIVEQSRSTADLNILDLVMQAYGLEDGVRWHNPELYYSPSFEEEYNKVFFDPNYFGYIGDLNIFDILGYLKRQGVKFDRILKLRGNKSLYASGLGDHFVDAPNVYQFCDLLHSCEKVYCFTSGTATLASALGTKAVVLYGEGVNTGFHHCEDHEYVYLKSSFKSKLINRIWRMFNMNAVHPNAGTGS